MSKMTKYFNKGTEMCVKIETVSNCVAFIDVGVFNEGLFTSLLY